MQVVAETLAEEYHKQNKLRDGAKKAESEKESVVRNVGEEVEDEGDGNENEGNEEDSIVINVENSDSSSDGDGGMPLEGKLESEIECQKCHFKPKSTISTFVVLTLPVPQKVCSPELFQ